MKPQQMCLGEFINTVDVQRAVDKKAKRSAKESPEDLFAFHCRGYKLPDVSRQFKLLKSVQTPRKDNKNIPNQWRFDFAWPDFKLIAEIDGGVWMAGGGAHSHPVDIVRNMEKRNDAALHGFVIISFTPQQVKTGEAIAFTQRVLISKGWQRQQDTSSS